VIDSNNSKIYKWNQFIQTYPETIEYIDTEEANDLMMAMKSLGYRQEEIRRAIHAASSQLSDGVNLETGIKILLKHLL
jgi:Holliday junction resolvasome RuvABC DNA-binding subunit